MEIVQVIGSYAGFAAIVGLAILSALYFSQARDVRRLREWAGRAPERASQQEPTVPPGPEAAPAPRPPAAAAPAATQPPVAGPAPAGAPAGEAVTASVAPAATPAPTTAGGAARPAVAAATAGNSATATQATPDAPAAPAASAGSPAAVPGAPEPGEATAKPSPATGPPALPGAVPLGADRAAPAATGRLAPPGPAAARRAPQPPPPAEREPWYLRLAPRYIVLIVAGVLIVGGGAVYGITQLSADAPPAQRSAQPASPADADDAAPSAQAPVDPGQVTVSVLNGTTVPGLARRVSDDLKGEGFRRGRTDNATEQARAESVVFYADGSERAARAVGEQLSIGQRAPITGDARALAGNADVVVVLGADKM